MLTHLDLFSGIGGFALAAEWAGYETVQFCEIDPFCQKVLRKHWPDVPIHDDIRTLTADVVGQPIELCTGGFPCQPYSVAGKRRGDQDDRHLWPEVFRIVGECRPRWVLGENVPGFIGMALDDCLTDLESIGYEVWTVVLPACAVGAWHQRSRIWIIAHAENRRVRRGIAPWETGFSAQLHETTANAECGGRRESLRADAAQGPFPQTIGAQSPFGTRPSGADAAHAIGHGQPQPGGRISYFRRWLEHGGQALAPESACELPHGSRGARDGRSEPTDCGWTPDDSNSGRHGASEGEVRPRWNGAFDTDWWEFESRVRGVPPGVSTGMDRRENRLKALGNSIVPQVAYEIIAAMRAA